MLTVLQPRISRKLLVLFMPVALILGTIGAPSVAAAGLVVTDLNHGVTTSQLAQTLAGAGVTVSNVTLTGTNNSAGTFTGGTGIVGFESGVILGSGSVQTVPASVGRCSSPGKGVEGPNQCNNATTSNGTAGDADLTALAGVPTHDATILAFDFVPQFSSVQFSYVFSSDEYSEFANTSFNDTFAFFVNGVNCALVPGTSLPVSVNTINGGRPLGTNPQHPQFYRDNTLGTNLINAEPDGFTTVLTCDATVNAGVSNHMKLAIADGSDSILDSNVFLKAGSLVSGTQIATSLSGGGQSGVTITVPSGTAVHDTATLSGANVATAGGTVTYAVFNDTACTNQVGNGGTKTVTAGVVPDSDPLTFSTAGTYYWRASYSGDGTLNNPSVSPCGSEQGSEVETVEGGGLTSLSDAHLWLGLRNSDDQGTQFDVKVELFRNAETSPLASGLTRCVTGLTRNQTFAKDVAVHWDPFSPISLAPGDALYIKISTRIGTTGTGSNPDAKCPGPGGSHNNAVALRFYYDAASRNSNFDATIGATNSNLYFHSDGGGCDKPAATVDSRNVFNRFLDSNTSTGTLVKCKDSGHLNFNGGNPYTEVGRWTLP